MIRPIVLYLNRIGDQLRSGWNEFWFTPSDPYTLGLMRLLTGMIAIYFQLTYSFDLLRWFGEDGLLPVELIDRVGGSEQFRVSLLDGISSPTQLWIAHACGFVILVLFTAGVATRATSWLALTVVLTYIHRAPILTGLFEPILALTMFYLCLGPCGAHFSMKRWRANDDNLTTSWTARISQRLLQVHLSLVYVMMAMGKLAEPGETWWLGEAVWWIAARPGTRLIDLTGWLHEHLYVINAWSHAIVLFELSFGILVWNRLARPLLLAVALVMWSSLALITGLLGFCAMMIVANLAFVPGESLRQILTRRSVK